MAKKILERSKEYLNIAEIIGSFGTCNRANVGAIIVPDHGAVVATGYNGSPSQTDHCKEHGCSMHKDHCIRTTHAEQNAIIHCAKTGTSSENTIMFSTHEPCLACTKSIINAGIKIVVFRHSYLEDSENDQIFLLKSEMLTQSGLSILSEQDVKRFLKIAY